MKLIHVIPHISEEASGPSYSVPRLCQSLAERGHQVELSCLGSRGAVPGVLMDVHRQWTMAGRFAISTSHAGSLRRKVDHVDVVHNHSLWSMVNVAAGWIVPGHHAKLVTSPRGTLSAWARSRSRTAKKLLWPLQRRALARADLLHATSMDELQQIRDAGLTAPVAVIPNGVDVPDVFERDVGVPVRTLLFLGRLHPTKCVDRLLIAWERLQERHPEWQLVIAGPGEKQYVAQLQACAADLGLDRARFVGPVYGDDKRDLYRVADLFILPSHSENFGMAVAEALAHGCPAIVSRGAPWEGLAAARCGWWVDHDIPSLVAAMDHAMSMPPAELAKTGRNGRAWMMDEFGWDAVAGRMEQSYRWILGETERPEWVHVVEREG